MWRGVWGNMHCFQGLIQNIEAVVTILAIIIGGLWTYILFVKNREKFPKADIKHIVEKINVSNEIVIRLTIEVKNLGKTKLPVTSGEVRLQQIKPSTTAVLKAVEMFNEIENNKKREIGWPVLEERIFSFKKDEYELEPAEKDNFEFDFIVSDEIELIQFYTHIENGFKEDKGWNYTSIHELK